MRRSSLLAALLSTVASTSCGATSTTPSSPEMATAFDDAGAVIPGARQQRLSTVRSDANARVLVALEVEFTPEDASELGVEEADEKTVDLTQGFRARHLAALRGAIGELETRRTAEADALLRQDLDILLREAALQVREIEVGEQTMVPHWDPARIVFNGLHVLLNDQVAAPRRQRALMRLKRYAGLLPGTRPLVDQARADVMAHLARSELVTPARIDVEKTLATTAALRDGIEKLLQKYQVPGYDEPLRTLSAQLAAYDDFLRTSVLPRARPDFALPPAIYALCLERVGVDMPAAELVTLAHQQFAVIQAEMQKVAAQVAHARGLPSPDYRDVFRELKKEQLVGDAILPHYQQRLADVEAIIRREHLVTLPSRPARIRLAIAAESAESPAPHMDPPRLIGNTGEQGVFVLPLSIPAPSGSQAAEQKFDDFTFAAASWTLVAHEIRPGHELQFDSMVERGVSIARAHYAFNSANVEGWGLYSEAITLPFMPPEGQLVSLAYRLHRAARAFLDPELQQGKWTFETARDFLEKEVGLSPAMATSEAERYTFRSPGQATSYFYGFTRLMALRHEAEQRLGSRFDARAFHDAILGEGLLPPDLLRAAVLSKIGVT